MPKEVTVPATRAEIMEPSLVLQKDDLISKVEANLFEDMERVRADKDYIPQAKQSQMTANSIISARILRLQQEKFSNGQ